MSLHCAHWKVQLVQQGVNLLDLQTVHVGNVENVSSVTARKGHVTVEKGSESLYINFHYSSITGANDKRERQNMLSKIISIKLKNLYNKK